MEVFHNSGSRKSEYSGKAKYLCSHTWDVVWGSLMYGLVSWLWLYHVVMLFKSVLVALADLGTNLDRVSINGCYVVCNIQNFEVQVKKNFRFNP